MENPLSTGADITSYLAEFVDDEQYLFFAMVSREWRVAWGQRRPKVTRAVTSDTTLPQLLYSFECGLGKSSTVCDAAAAIGRLDLLQCARSFGCPWGSVCSKAAAGGHLNILKFARANGCPINWTTYRAARRKGHANILSWARTNKTFLYFAMGAC